MGPAAKPIAGIPELALGRPKLLLQDIWIEHKYLTGVIQFFTGVHQALLRLKQPKRLYSFPVHCDGAVQHSGMAAYYKVAVVLRIQGNVRPSGPLLIDWAEAPVPRFLLERIGQHPRRPLITKIPQYAIQAVRFQVHPVKRSADGLLNGCFACNVGLMAGTPQGQLTLLTRLFRRI